MSSLTTTSINTINGATDLTVTTGNTVGPKIVVGGANSVWIGNSSANTLISSGQGIRVPVALTVNGATIVANSVTISGATSMAAANATTLGVSGAISGTSLAAANATLSTNTFTLGTSSIAASGFTRLPNGLLYQWGTTSVTSTTGTITFPVSFSTVYSVVATGNTAGTTWNPAITAITTASATVRTANTTAATAYWMAIGV